MRILKTIVLSALALFLAFGSALWFWVAYTQQNPELARAAFMIAPCPGCASILLASQARKVYKPDR